MPLDLPKSLNETPFLHRIAAFRLCISENIVTKMITVILFSAETALELWPVGFNDFTPYENVRNSWICSKD